MELKKCTGCKHDPSVTGLTGWVCNHPDSNKDSFWKAETVMDDEGYPHCYDGAKKC